MEGTNGRSRGRKRYCCCYCNVYFYQIDSWQRHNRKHTGVEIECDDCGEMCSDNFELKSHQQVCEGYRVYSEELFTEAPGAEAASKACKEQAHDTPDSTSKQELSNDTEEGQPQWALSSSRSNQAETSPVTSVNEDSNKTSELDDLIGEDREANNALDVCEDGQTHEENDDPETEAMIGLDETVSNIPQKTDTSPSNHIKTTIDDGHATGVDSQIVIKVDSALNDTKQIQHKLTEKGNRTIDGPSFLSRPPSGQGVSDSMQVMTLENSELNKKYQPYFCKNCGARFTRKDSVTRHLKKGTCSGKSAIVCSICGKVFPELFELQQHFKLDHKNVLLAPTLVAHRTILPKPSDHSESGGSRPQHFSSYPAPFVLGDRHHPPGSRPHPSSESQQYRSLPPHGMQGVYYPSSGGGHGSYRRRNNYPSTQGGHYRDQHYPSSRQQYDLKYSPSGLGSKEGGLLPDKTLMSRKRAEYHARDKYSERDDNFIKKRNKLDFESTQDSKAFMREHVRNSESTQDSKAFMREHVRNNESTHDSKAFMREHVRNSESKNQINLSEYTNNAMNSQQYFSKRFAQKEQGISSASNPENESTSQVHQCKICGNEFPRFEYLLTHLRKHKEKPEQEDELKTEVHYTERQDNNNNLNTTSALNSPVEMNDKQRSSNNFDLPKTVYGPNHEPVTVVMQQPPKPRYTEGTGGDNYLQSSDASPIYSLPPPPPQAAVIGDSSLEAITPGVDGKFRPFICENCGQRFTRKDSLVRHAKKQTCYEEQTDLQCKHCDKTFRYHKCLFQHQELVHGVLREEQSKPSRSEDDDTDSDRSEKNESNSSTDAITKYRSPTNPLLEVSPKPPKTFNPTPIPPPHSTNFAGTPFMQLEQPNTPLPHPSPSQAPKFIPPRVEEKIKITHHHSDANGPPLASVNSQDTQYIGYCTVPRPFQCEYCGDRFAHRHSLKRHIRRHLGIGIPCHECGKLYRDQSEWRRHQRSIHNRHYEKYEVPSRISFRDGVENGMIGVVQSSEYRFDNNDGSDSDKSDEDMSMVKNVKNHHEYEHAYMSDNKVFEDNEQKKLSEVTNQPGEGVPMEMVSMAEDERSPEKMEDKENKQAKQAFSFKLHSAGDKDSRKSVLDRYLRSSNSDDDDGDDEDEREYNDVTHEEVEEDDEASMEGSLEISKMKETGFETNNNNLVEMNSKVNNRHDNTLSMATVAGAQV